ncbi:MAG: hypothetical protein R3234_03895 [Thermoanaerobaculia bacterium]|nr:hypothetical protein [Thermoanaerobaculia bacterium]
MATETESSFDLSFEDVAEEAEAAGSSPSEADLPPPPSDRDELLARAGPWRRKLFRLARSILDELESAAPWSRLYYPPDDPTAFLAMEMDLLEVVEAIPARIRETLDPLVAEADDEDRQTLEDAEFYFSGIHGMVERELGRLRSALEDRLLDPSRRLPLPERDFVCELTADLKGKYASALMGATASLVAEGRWSGVAVEPILFPEKKEEFRRNEELVSTLEEVLDAIEALPEEVGFEDLHRRWSEEQRVDQYALTDLATFRGLLGRLLRQDNRRALYSGDYHQIRRRENRLSRRVNELESTHQKTWYPEDGDDSEPYRRLTRRLLEIAAILDVEVLERLIGESAVQKIRGAVTAERAKLDETYTGLEPPGGDDRHRKRLPEEHRSLVPLLYEDDLVSFLRLLLGNVRKRASLRPPPEATPSPEEVPASTPEVSPPDDELAEIGAVVSPEPKEVMEEEPATTQSTATPREVLPPAEEQREAMEELRETLERLRAPANPKRRPVEMLQRLLEKHSRVPPSMLQACEPYFHELLNELVPQLENAVRFGAVPEDARQRLVQYCLSLSATSVTPEQMEQEVPRTLKRIERLLGALSSATAAALR